jgi:hypothetical protein
MNIRHPDYGLLILAHPSLPDYPPRWILRQQRSMQNPVFPGRTPIRLPTDKPLVLRYGLVIHHGEAGEAQLRSWHADYAARGVLDKSVSDGGNSDGGLLDGVSPVAAPKAPSP